MLPLCSSPDPIARTFCVDEIRRLGDPGQRARRRLSDAHRGRNLRGGVLTAHESRLLELLVDGHSYRTMADVCGVSVNTVAFHMKRIYQKLDVHSKSQAVARAIRGGLVRSVEP